MATESSTKETIKETHGGLSCYSKKTFNDYDESDTRRACITAMHQPTVAAEVKP